ncbi:galactose/methyl galactoside ABC transporter permease MglC [Treponema denticola]|uniref:galactose/methyl galactoside ABC transporter permease MglC n=1 Tax=Treponema denticola TaxID=158 RepID=UPI0020A34F06|nr:galactoside ABC transporter permease [Treponema denticola]UTC92107.1 galactoside ABC transporter permease [Treponema denticola]
MENKNNEKVDFSFFNEDEKLAEYGRALQELRKDGVDKIASLKNHIYALKKNRLIDDAVKISSIEEYKKEIEEAKKTALENKDAEKKLAAEAVAYSNKLFNDNIKDFIKSENQKQKQYKIDYENQKVSILQENEAAKKEAYDEFAETKDSAELNRKLNVLKFQLNSSFAEAKNKYRDAVATSKEAKNQAYIDHVQKNISLRNGRTNLKENMVLNFKDYIYKFKLSSFLLSNGLYLAILVFFIICIIVAPLSGNGHLLSLPNIFTILEQASTRMFYALGVAGLILLAGTDLSIGRMVALGSVITGLILHPGLNIVTFFGLGPWDFTAMPMVWRLILSLGLSILLCVLFSAFAGVFSARLKIHPFISTLATQLIIYGLLFFGTSGTPVGSIDNEVKDLLGGRWILGIVNNEMITLPKLIIPALIAIIIAWFIWNKTVFGKNMYAVGGNSEAAAVSGISVFKVTMGVFIMAGVFYGVGSFLEAFRANASAGTGQGYELDAIAACVVGGISFNGGIGKISGAVIGVIIFTSLTYCLTFLGIDTNLQFVFKGFIIIAAVALDSVKYLKKK